MLLSTRGAQQLPLAWALAASAGTTHVSDEKCASKSVAARKSVLRRTLRAQKCLALGRQGLATGGPSEKRSQTVTNGLNRSGTVSNGHKRSQSVTTVHSRSQLDSRQ